jgi:dihydroorotase
VSHRLTVISGARIVDPDSGFDGVADLVIGPDGNVLDRGQGLAPGTDGEAAVVDARGLLLLPGFLDLHVHFREPGHEYKETIATGAASAVAGGFTTVACMANTMPVNDTGAVTRFMVERARAADLARVLPVGALSRGLLGQELAEIGDMVREGAIAVSDDGKPVMDAHLMRRALEYTRIFDVPVSVHEEDSCLAGRGCMNEGAVSTRLGLPGIPNLAEDVMVARDVELADWTKGRLHVAHLSTRGAVRLVRDARARGVRVTAEVTPHHFTLTDEACQGYDPATKMAPPLRTEADRRAVIEGMRDGTIQAIATDHAPHATVEKELEFELCSNGVLGLETAWGLTMRLVESGEIALTRAVELLTTGPAGAFSLPAGTMRRGRPADLVLIDPAARTAVEPAAGLSKSRNTPFAGWVLPHRVVRTWVGGRTRYRWDGARARLGDEAER